MEKMKISSFMIEEKKYYDWKAKFPRLSIGKRIRQMIDADLNLDDTLNELNEELTQTTKAMQTDEAIKDAVDTVIVQQRKSLKEQVEKSEELRLLLVEWRKAHIKSVNEKSKLAGLRAQQLRDLIMQKYGVDSRELIHLAERVGLNARPKNSNN